MSEHLDLTKVFDRHTVALPDGASVSLRNRQEFGVLEWHEVVSLDTEAKKLAPSAAKSPDVAQKVSDLQKKLAGLLIVEDVDIDAIPDWACSAVISFWADRLQEELIAEGVLSADGTSEARPPRKSRPTSGKSSRGSKSSTVATRKRGSTSRSTR